MEEETEGDFTVLNDEFVEEPEEFVENSSKACSVIHSGQSRQAVEKLAIELLASRLVIYRTLYSSLNYSVSI